MAAGVGTSVASPSLRLYLARRSLASVTRLSSSWMWSAIQVSLVCW
jgi:hypothetical protein